MSTRADTALTAVVCVVLALVVSVAVVWGAFLNPAPANEIPAPQETGWNHRNFR